MVQFNTLFVDYQYNIGMLMTNLRRGLGFLILSVALLVLAWGYWPAKRDQRLVEIPGLALHTPEENPNQVDQAGMLKLTWPARMQVGSVDRVQAQLAPAGQTLTPETGQGIVSEKSAENAGEQWAIEARLEIPEVMFEPAGTIGETLSGSAPLEFTWWVRPSQIGSYKGIIWLHKIGLATDGNDAAQRRLLSAQPVEIQVTSLFGLNAYLAQVIGIVGAALGAALIIDLLVPRSLRKREM
jgi:hypothetical protein